MHCSVRRKICIYGCLIILVYLYLNHNKHCNAVQKEEERLIEAKLELDAHEPTSKKKLESKTASPVKVFNNNTNNLKEFNKKTGLPLTLTGDYILNNPDLCSGTDNLTALVMVHTAPGHFERRQNIRSTYGSSDLFENKLRVIFLLGTVENEFLRDAILQEHQKYKDTIQGNFIDSYHNLTHKGVMGFRWITEHCSHVKYVVKVDDDAVFDMWRFLNFSDSRNDSESIFCDIVSNPWIRRKGKWKVDQSEFNETDRWLLDYCQGFVVILTSDVILPLFKAAHTTPFLWIDDVYLYGFLPNTTQTIQLHEMPKNLKLTSYEEGGQCLIKKGENCEYLAIGLGYMESNFNVFWNLIKKRNKIN